MSRYNHDIRYKLYYIIKVRFFSILSRLHICFVPHRFAFSTNKLEQNYIFEKQFEMTDQLTHGMIFLIQDVIHQTKSAMTYMNKFSICENDQFDILKIEYHGLTERDVEICIESSIAEVGVDLSFSHLEIFYFGVFDTSDNNKGVIAFEKLVWKILEKIKMNKKVKIRLSIVDFSPLKQTVQGYGKRIDKKEVKLHYKSRKQIITPFNNQLDIFYEKSQENFIGDEVVHYFHTELLDCEELKLYQTNYSKAFDIILKKQKRKYLNETHSHILRTEGEHRALTESEKWNSGRFPEKRYTKFKNEQQYEFRLYGGVRITLEFDLRRLQNGQNLHNLLIQLRAVLSPRLWRKNYEHGQIEPKKLKKREKIKLRDSIPVYGLRKKYGSKIFTFNNCGQYK